LRQSTPRRGFSMIRRVVANTAVWCVRWVSRRFGEHSRKGGQMARGAKKQHSRKSNYHNEKRLVEDLDEKVWAEQLFANLTADERLAFSISLGLAPPEGRHTRTWARKVVRDVAETNLTVKMSLYALKANDLNKVMDIADFLVSKAPRELVHTGDENKPIQHSLSLSPELQGLIDSVVSGE